MQNQLNERIILLERKIKRSSQVHFVLLFCLGIALVSLSFSSNEKFGLIRAKGIIIEDEQGKDRILIGAPIPYSANRVRTDTALVKKYWASKYKNPEQYMNWYKDYSHAAVGIAVLNENGFDRVQFGDDLSDPNTGKRMFKIAGIVWNDKEGEELGGAGVNTLADGRSRAVMGVDDSEGEAVHVVALEEGTKGLFIRGKDGNLFIGLSKKDGEWFKNKAAFSGIKYFNASDSLLFNLQMNNK